MKRIILGLIGLIIIVGGIFTGWYLFLQESRFIGTPALSAIAPDIPVFLEINEVSSLVKKMKDENDIWKRVRENPPWNELDKQIRMVDSLNLKYADIRSFTKDKKLTIAFDFIGKEQLIPIYIFPLNDIAEKHQLAEAIQMIFSGNDVQMEKRKYNGEVIFDGSLYLDKELVKFSFAFPKGLAVFSSNSMLVENAILQVNEESVEADYGFRKIHKTVGENSDINIYVNHKYFPRLLKQFVNKKVKEQEKELSLLAEWTELDFNIKKQSLNWNGFTYSSDSLNQYMNLFLHQTPGNIRVDEALPFRTIWFKAYHLSDFSQFQEDYNRYLIGVGQIKSRDLFLSRFKDETGLDLIPFLKGWFDGDVAFCASEGEKTPHHFLVFSSRSESLAKEEFVRMLKRYCIRKGLNFGALTRKFRVDRETSFTIYSNPYPDFHNYLFQNNLTEKHFRYFSFINNNVVFGESYQGVSEFLHDNLLQETLGKKSTYHQFSEQLSRESNLYIYGNPSRGIEDVLNVFSSELQNKLLVSKDEFKKITGFGWKAGSSNQMIYNSGCLIFDPEFRERASTIWQSHLDTSIHFKPQFVYNHLDWKNKDVVVQDLKNNLYIINNSGRIVWKMKLSGPVLGEIHQIDYYRNGKLQYLFNTPDQLHLVDRNGNYVEKYPVKFRAEATNGVAQFDYDNNKTYRFFVACKDKRVYAYDKYGKIVPGWKFDKTEDTVLFPVQHIRLGSKDYIVFNDAQKVYILDRRGNVRVNTKGGQSISNNPVVFEPQSKAVAPRLVYSDTSGDLHYQYFNGLSRKVKIEKMPPSHLFTYEDINNDGIGDVIFASGKKLEVIETNGKKIFQYEFNEPISVCPDVYSFSENQKMIGVVTRNDGRIHLLNSNGSMYRDFPLDGSSRFSIGFFSRDNRRFSLIVGNSDSFLYNYLVN